MKKVNGEVKFLALENYSILLNFFNIYKNIFFNKNMINHLKFNLKDF